MYDQPSNRVFRRTIASRHAFVSPLPFTSTFMRPSSVSRRTPSVSLPSSMTAPRMLVIDAASTDDMDKILKSAGDTLVVIDYSTTWCGPCKVFAPAYEEMSEKYTDVVFVKVMGNTEGPANQLMKREGIRAVPAFHFWKNEKKLKDFTGARGEELEKSILSLK